MTDHQEIAKNLRKPEGERGLKIAENMNIGNANTYAKMKMHLPLSASTKVLEIGFGNGVTSKEIIALCDYTGLDYSQDMVQLAQQFCAAEVKDGAQFLQGDVHQMPFDDASYDIIFTINTIYFWDEPQKAITELRRVLKPTGKLYVGMRTKEDMQMLNSITQHNFHLRSFVEIEELFRAGGFSEVMYTVYSDAPAQKANGELLRVHSVILQAE